MASRFTLSPFRFRPHGLLWGIVFVCLCLGAASPSWGERYTAPELLRPVLVFNVTRADDFRADYDDPSLAEGRALFASFAGLDFYSREIMLDESWEKWVTFQKNLITVMPLESLKRIVRVYYQPPGKRKRMVQRTRTAPSEVSHYVPLYRPSKRPKGMVSLFIFEDTQKRSPNPSKLFGWLFEEPAGLFSGREWDWDNFLPRLGTIAGFLLVGFLITEVLHYLKVLGKKMLKRGEQ